MSEVEDALVRHIEALTADLDEVRGQYDRAVAGWHDERESLEAERDAVLAGAAGARAALEGAAEDCRQLRAFLAEAKEWRAEAVAAAYERAAKLADEWREATMSLSARDVCASLAREIRALGGKP